MCVYFLSLYRRGRVGGDEAIDYVTTFFVIGHPTEVSLCCYVSSAREEHQAIRVVRREIQFLEPLATSQPKPVLASRFYLGITPR